MADELIAVKPVSWFGGGLLVVDADGYLLANNNDCPYPPCTCFDEKACFRRYTTVFDCETLTWSTPVAGARECKPVGTSTTWVPDFDADADGCAYYKWHPCGTDSCTDDTDCSACAGDPPPAPTEMPAGCCTNDCEGEDCGSCSPPGTTPDKFLVVFDVNSSPKCSYLTGDPFYVYRTEFSLNLAQVFQTADPCIFEGDVTAQVAIWRCNGDGTGCDGCTLVEIGSSGNGGDYVGDTNIVTSATLRVTLPGGSLSILVTTSDDGIPSLEINMYDPTPDTSSGCANPWGFTLGPADGFENWYDMVDGMIAGLPCAEA